MKYYDPLKLTEETIKIVVKEDMRKYYRVGRSSRWYGGIVDSYCCGCNLRCVFCWSGFPRDHPEDIGRFYSARQIFEEFVKCARQKGLKQVRITGNEPTLGRRHLVRVLELIDATSLLFILETNGILIGNDPTYAEEISKYRNVHVRVALKGTNRFEFARLTRAEPKYFNLQLKALENLLFAGVSCHPALMLSFTTQANIEKLKKSLKTISPSLAENLEGEYVILYPPVVKRLEEAGIKPKTTKSQTTRPRT